MTSIINLGTRPAFLRTKSRQEVKKGSARSTDHKIMFDGSRAFAHGRTIRIQQIEVFLLHVKEKKQVGFFRTITLQLAAVSIFCCHFVEPTTR